MNVIRVHVLISDQARIFIEIARNFCNVYRQYYFLMFQYQSSTCTFLSISYFILLVAAHLM